MGNVVEVFGVSGDLLEDAHVLLRSLCHPQKDSELYTDLVPILLGFRDCVRRGRKNVRSTTSGGATTAHTTTYGYLTDRQFEFACEKVRGVLQRHQRDKKRLLALAQQVRRKVRRASQSLASFHDYVVYLDTHLPASTREEDARRIVQFLPADLDKKAIGAIPLGKNGAEFEKRRLLLSGCLNILVFGKLPRNLLDSYVCNSLNLDGREAPGLTAQKQVFLGD